MTPGPACSIMSITHSPSSFFNTLLDILLRHILTRSLSQHRSSIIMLTSSLLTSLIAPLSSRRHPSVCFCCRADAVDFSRSEFPVCATHLTERHKNEEVRASAPHRALLLAEQNRQKSFSEIKVMLAQRLDYIQEGLSSTFYQCSIVDGFFHHRGDYAVRYVIHSKNKFVLAEIVYTAGDVLCVVNATDNSKSTIKLFTELYYHSFAFSGEHWKDHITLMYNQKPSVSRRPLPLFASIELISDKQQIEDVVRRRVWCDNSSDQSFDRVIKYHHSKGWEKQPSNLSHEPLAMYINKSENETDTEDEIDC
jgi:hypothetical protein